MTHLPHPSPTCRRSGVLPGGLAACLALIGSTLSLPAQDHVWIEAEDFTAASAHSLESHPVLSNDKWIRLGDMSGSRFIEWEGVEIPEDGTYEIYVRKFWKHGPFRWTLDGPTTPPELGSVNADVVLLDEAELYQHNVANWVFLKEAKLKAGEHTFRIEQNEPSGAAAYDAILFTRTAFEPRGRLKPGETYAPDPEPGFFDFQPARDSFAPTPIDLRHLNEVHAGSRGWIRSSEARFEYPDTGEQLRFWGINLGPGIYSLDNNRIEYLARFFAKRGINLVRLHGAFYQGGGADWAQVKPWTLDRLHFAVKAFRQEGIYVMVSTYFPLWVDLPAGDPRFPGYDGDHPFALPFFSPDFEDQIQEWMTALMTTRNPYTGLALKDDPAIVACELVNEDSFFFWTFSRDNIPDSQMKLLEQQFAEWVSHPDRHGSVDSALSTWGETRSRDAPAEGRLEIKPLRDLGNPPHTQRDKDTVRFLAETQKAFFERNRDYLKDVLGYGGLVYGSNWKTASPEFLDPIDKWTNAGLDLMDRHGYFGPAVGSNEQWSSASYAVRAGHGYRDRSALRFDAAASATERHFENPIMGINYGGLPSICTEINWPEPNQYRADCIPMISSYAALQGLDAVVLFAAEADDWAVSQGKFPMQTPVTQAQFPGFALAFRKGLIETGSPAIEVTLHEDDLLNLGGTPVREPHNLDDLRDPGIGGDSSSASSLAFLVGPVNADFAEGSGDTVFLDHTAGHIDTGKQTVTSNTGQLRLDYGAGLLTINAPRAQGATGFFDQAGTIDLTDATLTSGLHYGSVLLVPLDDRPIATSELILVQVASDDHFSGFATRAAEASDSQSIRNIPAAKVITKVGSAPIMVAEFEGTISLKRADAPQLTVTACDENGIPGSTVGTADSFSLVPDVLYYLIHTTPADPPAAPPVPAAQAIAHDRLSLRWTAVDDATGYEIDVARQADFTDPIDGYTALNIGNRTEVEIAGLDPGEYFLRVRAYNLDGTGSASPATAVTLDSRLLNLSTRGLTTRASPLTAGFVVTGSGKSIVVRAAAAALIPFGVGNTVPNPRLRLVRQSTGATIAANDDWDAHDPVVIDAVARAGIGLPFAEGSVDSVIVAADLEPGNYTALVETVTGDAGIALVELYEFEGDGRLVNLSTRGHTVEGGPNVIIPGTIFGPTSKELLIRVVGETLGNYLDPALVLADPILEIFDMDQPLAPIVVNDDWDSDDTRLAATWTTGNPDKVSDLPFARGSMDAAVLVVLNKNQAGYTVLAKGKNGHEGTVLVEIYEVF